MTLFLVFRINLSKRWETARGVTTRSDQRPGPLGPGGLALQLLSGLSAEKVESLTHPIEEDLRTAETSEHQTVPVTKILERLAEYRAFEDVGRLTNGVSRGVKNSIACSNENMVEELAKPDTTAMVVSLGESTGTQQECYVIMSWCRVRR